MFSQGFLSPVAGSNVSDPLWGPIWVSLCFISHPRRSFLDFNFELVIVLFWHLKFFIVTDGGRWTDGGWVPKRFSDFSQNFFRWSSQHITLPYFGKSAKNFFYRKKIRLQVSKSGVFSGKKIFRNFLETSVIISLLKDSSLYFAKKFQKLF